MDCESDAEEDLEQRSPGGVLAAAEAHPPAAEAADHEKENISGGAARPQVEDATCKVSMPPSVPCSQPYVQHLAPLDT